MTETVFEPLNVTVAAFVAVFFIGSAIWLVYNNTPKIASEVGGISKIKLWNLLKPVVVKGYKEVEVILKDRDLTYVEVEDIVLRKLMAMIRTASFLSTEQKNLLTDDLIRSWVRPSLKVFYKEVQERKKNNPKV